MKTTTITATATLLKAEVARITAKLEANRFDLSALTAAERETLAAPAPTPAPAIDWSEYYRTNCGCRRPRFLHPEDDSKECIFCGYYIK